MCIHTGLESCVRSSSVSMVQSRAALCIYTDKIRQAPTELRSRATHLPGCRDEVVRKPQSYV
jgi:hypothetical protein